MKSLGIITIHKINNYGSVFQAYALQKVCEDLGYKTEIIDYTFPNEFHRDNQYVTINDSQPNEPRWIKLLYARDLIRQHKGIEALIGVPCVSTDCSPGGAAMLIQNKKNGLLVLRNNVHALADAMEYMICHPIEAEQMGKNGMYVCDAFSEKVIAGNWLPFIGKCHNWNR